MIIALSSIGLPLLNGFIGELLILVGTFSSTVPYARTFAVIGTSGVILSAVYLLWMLQRVLFGETDKPANEKLEDLDVREKAALVPLVVMAIVMGIAPMIFLRATQASVNQGERRNRRKSSEGIKVGKRLGEGVFRRGNGYRVVENQLRVDRTGADRSHRRRRDHAS